jgi:WD40 repeat protein/uncharacterized caspase-like protein
MISSNESRRFLGDMNMRGFIVLSLSWTLSVSCVAAQGDPSRQVVTPAAVPNVTSSPAARNAQIETVPNLPNAPYSFAFSSDGRLALSGGSDGTVDLWDVHSGRLLRTMSGHTDKIFGIAFLSNGTRVISVSADKSVKLWDTVTGQLLRSVDLKFLSDKPDSAAISADGSRVVTGIAGKGVTLWDAATGQLIMSFARDGGYALAGLTFSPDGGRIVSGSAGASNQVKIWDAASGKLIRAMSGHKNHSSVDAVAFSADGTQVVSAAAANDNTVKLWDASSGKLLRTFVHADSVYSVAISPDKTYILSGSMDKTLKLWDAATGRLVRSLDFNWASWGIFSPDGKSVLAGSPSGPVSIRLLNIATGEVTQFGRGRDYLNDGIFSADGNRVISGGGTLRQWDAKSGQLLTSFAPIEPGANILAFSRDGSQALWRLADGKTLKLVDTSTQKVISAFASDPKRVDLAAISPDGLRVVSFGDFSEGKIKLWDAKSGRLIRVFSQDSANALAFSPDGSRILAGCFDKTTKLWDAASGQLLRTLTNPGPVWSAAFSPDGTQILAGDTANNLVLWDIATGRKLRSFPGHTGAIYHGVAFSPDGSHAISASQDKTLRLWDVATGRMLRSISGDFRAPVFSPDGNRVLTSGEVWDLNSGERLVNIIPSAGSDEWLAITSEGFFTASENGVEILSVVQGLDVYSIDQFFQSLYRPDLVREKLAGDPRGLVREAAARLDLAKVMASGNAPSVRLKLPGRSLGQGTPDGTSVSAEAEIKDLGGGIGRVEWRVNGVTASVDTPAAASGGMPVMLTRSLSLDPGDNTIEVVAYNGANLIASVPARLSVATQLASPSIVPSQPVVPSTTPAPALVAAARSRLFVLVAGVNQYADKRFTLSYAVSDARDIARGFQQASGGIYQSAEVKLMTDAEVTRDKLDAAFAEMAGKVSAADVFVLYLAGHGKTVDGRYYFIPQDFAIEGDLSDKAINAAVKSKAIAQEQWQRWFATIPARKSVILFDTCDSGTLAGDETQQLEKGAANSRLSQATGRSILTASGGSQEALEGYHGHGLFTYEILDAINQADGDRNGTVELNELAAYVYAQVSELSEIVFKQRQVPEMKITTNFPLARQTRILQDETTPVAEAKPTYQTAQTAQLQVQPNSGATVVRSLSAKTSVTVLESKNGWSLVASEGKPIGYVATRDLAPVQ